MIPGPVMIVAVAVAGLGVMNIAGRWRRDRDPRDARFATVRDLRALTLRGPEPGRITLGRIRRRLVAIEQRHSVLVVGPPQTGKTAGLAIPAILEWPGPVLVTSSKSDILEVTRRARETRGPVMVYDPCSGAPGTSGWTPLAAAAEWSGALIVARAMLSIRSSGAVGTHDFWHAAAEAALAPMLRAAAHDGDMRQLIVWLDRGEAADDEIARYLDRAGDPLATSSWEAVVGLDPRTRSGVIATARTALAGWWDPAVLGAARPEITPERLLDGAASLYLVAPTHEQDRLRNIYAAIVSEMTRAVFTRRARTGSPLDPALLVVLDEAAHIAPVRDLAALAATGPEPGIQLVTVFHDYAQIQAIYGPQADSVVANHRARLLLGRVGDPETLARISRSLGTRSRRRQTRTSGRLGATTTDTETSEPLVTAPALREMPHGEALLVYGAHPPVRLRLRFWFADRALRRLTARGGVQQSLRGADRTPRDPGPD
jgi:type IV secretion system protein VirD4